MSLRGGKRLVASVVLLWGAVVCGFGQQTEARLARASDLEGRQVQPLHDTKAKAVVLFFVQTSCPISNRYAPEIKRLYDKFASAGVIFWLVYPDGDDTLRIIRRHRQEYGYKLGALRDAKHHLVQATGASVTPEAAIFVPSKDGPQLIYRGRIDDRVVTFGKTRPAPTTRDVEQVLNEILSGQTVTLKTTVALGCAIPVLD